MTDPTRSGFFRSTYDGQRVIDARFTAMAKRIPAVIREAVGDRPLEPRDHAAIMSAVDRELDKLLPRVPGAPSLLESDIVAMSNRARVRAVKTALAPVVALVKQRDPELAEAIRHAGTDR